jgi:hypothetical protein
MKLFLKVVNFFFSGYFNLIASLASIIGILVLLFKDKYAIIIALVSLVIFLIIILLRVFYLTQKFILQKTENGYHKFATYVRYSTEDGKHIVFELHKYLQCKSILMNEHEHNFYWTGTESPRISSSLQEFKEFVKMPKGQYDKAIFRFKTPLSYNDFAIVHIRMDLNDENQQSKPFCEQTINEPIQLINFRIELRHLANNGQAKFLRRRVGTPITQEYDILDYVAFDSHSRSYEYSKFNPDVGFCYRLEWPRP